MSRTPLQQLAGDLGIGDRDLHGFTAGKASCPLTSVISRWGAGIQERADADIWLKAREYLPAASLYHCRADPDFPRLPYILRLPADESPIDIEQVLAFAKGSMPTPTTRRRCAAMPEHLDWSVKMKKPGGFLEALVGRVAMKASRTSTPPLLQQD